MGSYNRIKASQQAPIGTIMPWAGGSGAGDDGVPSGWIVCNSSKKGLYAADYPLLARTVGNVYGPFPSNQTQQQGLNIGIIFTSNGGKGFPYNPPAGRSGHDPNKPVDTFDLPNLNQIALVDIESTRISDATIYEAGNPTATPPIPADHRYNNLLTIGTYLSPNGSSGTQAPTEDSTAIDLVFSMEASSNLAGRITGITMEDPIYFTTVYVIPRKLGTNHMPRHTHRALDQTDASQFYSAFPQASPLLEFVPGNAVRANSVTNTSSINPASQRSSTGAAQTFTPGLQYITFYDQTDGGISMVLTDGQKNIGADTNNDGQPDTNLKLPDIDVYPGTPATTRAVGNMHNTGGYNDDYSGVAAVAADAHVGAFPPPGRYSGKRNYYASIDIPTSLRGSGMPQSYIPDMSYTGTQPVNTNVPPMTGNTFSTTLNHDSERWADGNLRSHAHDAMEVSMGKGLSIPTTLLVNNVSTGTSNPVTQDTALTVAINPNTPSATMMYIMRAY